MAIVGPGPAAFPNCQDVIPHELTLNAITRNDLRNSSALLSGPGALTPHIGPGLTRRFCTKTPATAGAAPINVCQVDPQCTTRVCNSCNRRNRRNWERVLEAGKFGCCTTCIQREVNNPGGAATACTCANIFATPATVCEACLRWHANSIFNDPVIAVEIARRMQTDYRVIRRSARIRDKSRLQAYGTHPAPGLVTATPRCQCGRPAVHRRSRAYNAHRVRSCVICFFDPGPPGPAALVAPGTRGRVAGTPLQYYWSTEDRNRQVRGWVRRAANPAWLGTPAR